MTDIPTVTDGNALDADLDWNPMATKVNDHETRLLSVESLGVLAYEETTTAQTGITSTETDLTGLSATVTVGSGRMLRITGYSLITGGTADGRAICNIKEGATNFQADVIPIVITTGSTGAVNPIAIVTPTAGSHTYKLTMQGSSATVGTNPATGQPAFILIEDIGPAPS